MGSFSLLSHIRTTHSPGRKTALQRLAHTPPVTVNISNTAQRPSNFYLPPPKFHGEFGEAAVSLDGLTGLASPNGKASGFWMSGQSKNDAVIASRLGMDTAPMAARIESLTAVVGNFEDAIQIKQKGEWIITDADGREIGRAMLLTGGAEGRFDFDDEKSNLSITLATKAGSKHTDAGKPSEDSVGLLQLTLLDGRKIHILVVGDGMSLSDAGAVASASYVLGALEKAISIVRDETRIPLPHELNKAGALLLKSQREKLNFLSAETTGTILVLAPEGNTAIVMGDTMILQGETTGGSYETQSYSPTQVQENGTMGVTAVLSNRHPRRFALRETSGGTRFFIVTDAMTETGVNPILS